MDIVSKERLKLYNDLLKQRVPDNNNYAKLREKTLSCLTTDSLESYGTYIKDVIYYRDHILYCIKDTDSLYIKYPSNSTVSEFSGCFGSFENKSIYLYEDSSYYYIYTLAINALNITIKQVKFTKADGNISSSKPIITAYTGALSSGDTLYNSEFYVYNDYAYISILNGSTYYVKKLNLSSSITISDLYSSSSPFYIKPDVFDLSCFYILNATSVKKISADGSLQSTTNLPYTISTTGFIDYFNNYVVYTTNGLIFYITNLTTSQTNMIVCEDDVPLLDSSNIRTLKIKKITNKGALQFYLGLTEGRHIKFYSDTTSFVRLEYSFIDPSNKVILKIVADPYKNTENILITYDTQAKQIRVLNENIQASGAGILARLQDTTKQQIAELTKVKDTVKTNSANIGTMQYDITHLTNTVNIKTSDLEKKIVPTYKNQGLCGTDSIDNYKTYGVYAIYSSSSTPSGLPLDRATNEKIYLFIINTPSVGDDCIQTLYYTKQKITYRRFYAAGETVWSDWQKIINTPEALKNPNALTLTVNGTSIPYDGSAAKSSTWYAPTGAGTKGHQLVSNGAGAPVWEQPPYATCASTSTVYAKAITIPNFTPVAGKHIFIKFSNASYSHVNTAINLQVNGVTNAVYQNGKAVTGTTMYAWLANDIVEFMFDGSYWHIIQIVNRVEENNTVAHTMNIDDNGVAINTGGYPDSDAWTKVLTIPGASSLDVTVIYQSESATYDWGCVWVGNYPDFTAAANYSTSLTNKLAGKTKTTANYQVKGDTVTVAWKSDGSSHSYYGLYVSIKPSPVGGISFSSSLTYEPITT